MRSGGPLLVFALLLAHAHARSYFITSSKYVRPGIPYDVNVDISPSITEEVFLTVKIAGSFSYRTPTMVISQSTASFQYPRSSGRITLNMDKLSSILYQAHLVVEATGGLTFNKTKNLQVESKTQSIFIQTDKAIYKPGQTVKYRVIAFDSNLKPFTGLVDIQIFDSKKNLIKSLINRTSVPYGVHNGTQAISDQPNLGMWTIKATAGKEKSQATFEIAEYVLPKFEVSIEAPTYKLLDNQGITVTVVAKYTYGQPVKGNATVFIDLDYHASRYYGVPKGKLVRKLTLKDGRGDIFLTDEEILSVKVWPDSCFPTYLRAEGLQCHIDAYRGDGSYMPTTKIMVSANVTEKLTNKTLSGSGFIKIEKNSIKIEVMSVTPGNFKQDLPFLAMFKVSQVSGDPLDSTFLPLKMTVSAEVTYEPTPDAAGKLEPYPRRAPTMMEIAELNVEEHGIVLVQFDVPARTNKFNLLANVTDPKSLSQTHKYVTAKKYNIRPFESGSNTTIQLLMANGKGSVQAGRTETFLLKSTKQIPTDFNFVILSKGVVVTSDMVSAASSRRTVADGSSMFEYEFSIDFTPDLAQRTSPSARIVAFYITEADKLLADTIDFDVKGGIANKVTCAFSTTQTKPSANVSIVVTADPNSLVLLSAVDTSTTLAAGGKENGVTEEMVLSELKEYDASNQFVPYFPWMRFNGERRKKRSLCYGCWGPRTTGGSDTSQVLDRAGLVVITDAYIHEKEEDFTYPILARGMAGARGLAGSAGPAGPAGPSGPVNDAESGPPLSDGRRGSSKAGRAASAKPIKLRTEFPETWIWTEGVLGAEGSLEITKLVPDTITTWVLSTWAVNERSGLGVAPDQYTLTVFKPFFVSLTLPYAIILSEEFDLKITIFNYLKVKQEVTVTLVNEDKFYKVYKNGVMNGDPPTDEDVTKKVMVPANDGVTVNIWIKPIRLGQIPIKVTARGAQSADGVVRKLLVKPPGSTEEAVYSALLNMTGDVGEKSFSLDVDIPRETTFFVVGSEYIKVTAIGDIMGASLSNLGRLVRMPSGCGEQNMINFAPNIFVRKYLTATQRLTPEFLSKNTVFMEAGYQRELSYWRTDGGFSAFGNSDKSGSIWLTAFVIKSFEQARPFIDIDDQVLKKSADFILRYQNTDGSFNEPGEVHHKGLMGGSANGKAALTAYILIALQESKHVLTGSKYQAAVQLAQQFLEDNTRAMELNTYTVAISYYALNGRLPRASDTLRSLLLSRAVVEDGKLHFEDEPELKPSVSSRGWRPRYHQARSTDIEMTAYAMMALLRDGDMQHSLQISKWLVQQQNAFGGYASTQDTVIGLQSLSEFAEKTYGALNCVTNSLDISVTPDSLTSSVSQSFLPIDKSNALVLQSIELPKDTQKVTVTTRQCGFAMVQLQYQWNVMEAEVDKSIEVKVTSLVDQFKQVIVNACAKWLDSDSDSGMAVLELHTLSGYNANVEGLLDKYRAHGLKRLETDIAKLVMYLDKIPREELCISVPMEKVNDVSNMQASKVSMYSYYRPEKVMTKMYLPAALRSITPCDACPSCCLSPEPIDVRTDERTTRWDPRQPDPRAGGAAAVTARALCVALTLVTACLWAI